LAKQKGESGKTVVSSLGMIHWSDVHLQVSIGRLGRHGCIDLNEAMIHNGCGAMGVFNKSQ